MGKIGDETHSKLVEERAAAQKRLDIVRGEHSGKKDKHPDVILAEKKLAEIDAKIAKHTKPQQSGAP